MKEMDVSIGNDNSTKIIGEDTVRIENNNKKTQDVLLVEDTKHNLLSESNV
jgi:hypothetical protein